MEEIEYVLDRGLNYVPKRLINEMKLKSETIKQESITTDSIDNTHAEVQQKNDYDYVEPSADNDDDVIVIDSSPENSFTTTLTTERFKSAFESVENTFYTAKSILHNVSVVSIGSDASDEQPSNGQNSTNESTIEQTQPNEIQHEKSNTLQKLDISVNDNLELSTSTQINNDSAVTTRNGMEMPNFNDSLERVEYMMEQAEKMMDDMKKKGAPIQDGIKKTPVSQTKLKPKVLTPNGVSVKKATPKHLTPNKGDLFKRPDQRNAARSPFTGKCASASKVQSQQVHSRIPMKTGSSHKLQFRHIASPIAAYIKNTPEVPLVKTIKPMRNLHVDEFNKACKSNTLDESTQSVESFPTKSALPCKMYISAQQRQVNLGSSFLCINNLKVGRLFFFNLSISQLFG